jgi:hypothetical protein
MVTFTVKFSLKQYTHAQLAIQETIIYYRKNRDSAVDEANERFWAELMEDMKALYKFIDNDYVIAEGE